MAGFSNIFEHGLPKTNPGAVFTKGIKLKLIQKSAQADFWLNLILVPFVNTDPDLM